MRGIVGFKLRTSWHLYGSDLGQVENRNIGPLLVTLSQIVKPHTNQLYYHQSYGYRGVTIDTANVCLIEIRLARLSRSSDAHSMVHSIILEGSISFVHIW